MCATRAHDYRGNGIIRRRGATVELTFVEASRCSGRTVAAGRRRMPQACRTARSGAADILRFPEPAGLGPGVDGTHDPFRYPYPCGRPGSPPLIPPPLVV
jgi:hypothetical protein